MTGARKIAIKIRPSKKVLLTHARNKARAHAHLHEHDGQSRNHPSLRPIPIPRKPVLIGNTSVERIEIAYFCMEVGLSAKIPTYAGGLGILAGDVLKNAADLGVPMIGVTLRYRDGYFDQRFDNSGWQIEDRITWDPKTVGMELLPHRITLCLEGRSVRVAAWLFEYVGINGKRVPILFLDTDLPENAPRDRAITDQLYTGDHRHRLLQEAILGIGGMRFLLAIGATGIRKYHMNEGHSSLLTIELYRMLSKENPTLSADLVLEETRRRCVFTTHTPIASGHDQFERWEIDQVFGHEFVPKSLEKYVVEGNVVNMTKIGLNMSAYRNGVARRHGEVTRELFPGYVIDAITNGVYVRDWVSPPLARLYDEYLGNWRADNANLRYALSIPLEELWNAHQSAKIALCERIAGEGMTFAPEVFTVAFGRRMTAYKQATLLFADVDRLRGIAERSDRGIQIVYAGKAHPNDHAGKLIIQEILNKIHDIGNGKLRVIYLPNYNIDLARLMTAGADLWLNTPKRPQEASGTSGMKAALNGVPHFSVLDGWWLEGHIEGVTGWAIGMHPEKNSPTSVDHWNEDKEDLYAKLEYIVLPRYEKERDQWIRMMRQTIALNGSFFNTQRMLEQYVLSAYFT